MARRPKQRQFERTEAREALERRWFHKLVKTPQLAPLVTAEQNAAEPYHRWLAYKQAFAPKLVRLFLAQAENLSPNSDETPMLDPFAGSGTVPIECARQNRPAIGIEALECLCFLARACTQAPACADSHITQSMLADCQSWPEIADRLADPLHRAALMLAFAGQRDSDGRPLRDPLPIRAAFAQALDVMRADLANPLPRPVDMRPGDARALTSIADESVAGMLTSPPYLSRHDYTRLTRPLQQVYAHWYPAQPIEQSRRAQIRAHPRAHQTEGSRTLPATAAEAIDALTASGEPKLAGIVRSYFDDMSAALEAAARVLRSGAPCWIVVGGARLADVYIPSDLILAEIAEPLGLEIRQVREARRLTRTGRRLGKLENVAPRESLLILRRT